MQQQTKILIKQSLIVASALLISLFIYNFKFICSEIMVCDMLSIIVMPFGIVLSIIIVLYFMRLKKGNFKFLNITFRFSLWLFIIIVSILFLLEVFLSSDIYYYSEYSFLQNVRNIIIVYFSWDYIIDDSGLIYDLKIFLNFVPHLITVALLFWAIKINKQLDKK